jgi:transcriptional regulator with XRE-family HTH domain
MKCYDTNIKILFGHRLREIRTKKGISQEQLARDSSLNRTYISKIERGERNVSIETAYRLAQALSIPIKELFEFDE